MNATVAVVIVDDETNMSLSWSNDFPPVLLTDQLNSVSDDQTCNNFGRVAFPGISIHVVMIHVQLTSRC